MKIISFAWTTDVMVKGEKTVTRRDWNDAYAKRFKKGDVIQAYNTSPRFGGKPMCLIVLTANPYKQELSGVTDADEIAEGGLWGSGEQYIQSMMVGYKCTRSKKFWVIEFKRINPYKEA